MITSPLLCIVMTNRILLVGYGNVDRQDDGVAWHILNKIAKHLELPVPEEPDQGYNPERMPLFSGNRPDDNSVQCDIWFVPQLTPEMAETIAAYQTVCFIDAHTGNVPEEIRFHPIRSNYQTSAFTHHLTPQTCLELARIVYSREPDGYLISVRGYEFGFSNQLSIETENLSQLAANQIINWLQQIK